MSVVDWHSLSSTALKAFGLTSSGAWTTGEAELAVGHSSTGIQGQGSRERQDGGLPCSPCALKASNAMDPAQKRSSRALLGMQASRELPLLGLKPLPALGLFGLQGELLGALGKAELSLDEEGRRRRAARMSWTHPHTKATLDSLKSPTRHSLDPRPNA